MPQRLLIHGGSLGQFLFQALQQLPQLVQRLLLLQLLHRRQRLPQQFLSQMNRADVLPSFESLFESPPPRA